MKKTKLATALALSALLLTSCGTKVHAINEYILELPWQNNFKILQLSDIHIANKDEQDRQFDFLDVTIRDANKDNDLGLIIVTGDLFTFADRKNYDAFYSQNLTKDSYSACAGKWWNIGFGVKYSF